MSEREGFFPNGQCRHYQRADGWAMLWCIRTDDGHTEHETAAGVRWTPDRDNGCPYCAERERMNAEYNVQPPMGPCPLHAAPDRADGAEMRDDDATVRGLGADEANEIMQSENTCPCELRPRARHKSWCANREDGSRT